MKNLTKKERSAATRRALSLVVQHLDARKPLIRWLMTSTTLNDSNCPVNDPLSAILGVALIMAGWAVFGLFT